MKKYFLCLILLSFFSQRPGIAFGEENKLDISGYYKNLLTSTKSLETKEAITADLQRLRLEIKKVLSPWQFQLTLDNEAIVHDFANRSDFNFIRSKSQNRLNSIDLDKTSVDSDHLYLKHSLYRAFVKYYQPEFQIVAGKQGVDWGKMRFYSPLDLFNTLSPLEIERDERIGIDALNFNYAPEDLSGVNFVAAPGQNGELTSLGLKLYRTIKTYDVSFIAGQIKKDIVMGVSFDGYIQKAGFRGEISHTVLDNERSFPRVSVGLDYTFSDKFDALLEQFYNGGADDNDPAALTSSYRKSQQLLSLKKYLSNLWMQYRLTPLVKLNTYILYDWEGKSVVVTPEVSYNIIQNMDIAAGTQLFWGKSGSEFGDNEHFYYLEIKWFF